MPTITKSKNGQNETGLIDIVINPSVDEERGRCWELDFSSQFPVSSIVEKDEITTVQVGFPHEGYSIETRLVNNKMQGESTLCSNEDILVAELHFEGGIAEGPCKLYDSSGYLFFEGRFHNGYRSGKGKEYNQEGNVIFEGYYSMGKRIHVDMLNEMDGYWKEYDEKGKLLSISKRNYDSGEKEGICYYYDTKGNINRIMEVEEGKEVEYNGYCKIYDEPHKVWFEGFVKNGKRRLNLIRLSEMDGYWKEYDENGKLLSISERNDRNGEKEGICYYYDENGDISRIMEVEEGKEVEYNGYCKLYDEPHKVWFEGFVKNGKRRMNLIRLSEMDGYWKEYDEKGTLLSISKRNDDSGEKEGICYYYDTKGNISRITEVKKGIENEYNGYCKLYDEPHKTWFEGFVKNGKRRMNLIRLSEMDGYWKEYDEKGTLLSISKRNDDSGEKEGICYYYDTKGNISHVTEVQEGIENEYNGYCKIYDEPHKVWFEGLVKNGIRQGLGREYNCSRSVASEVFYEDGKKLRREVDCRKKGYWKEYDEQDQIVNICKRDENGTFCGICYRYNTNGKIIRISEWKDGKETTLIKTFNGNQMTEFRNGVKYYEGEFIDSLYLDYMRNGQGKEFDANGRTMIYKGYFVNGKRHGRGALYKNKKIAYDGDWIRGRKKKKYYAMVWGHSIVCIVFIVSIIVVMYIINVWMGISFTVVLIIALLCCLRWYYCRIRCGLDYQMAKLMHRPNLRYGNWYCRLTREFYPPLYVESIEIGNKCFSRVQAFKIDGLNRLKTIKIGNNSFTQVKQEWFNSYHNDDEWNAMLNNQSKSFHILNCESLESIQIGRYSFSDFAGEFELKNLPQLQSIHIGTIGCTSDNFFYSSFVIRGIELILNIVMIRSSKSTIHYIR